MYRPVPLRQSDAWTACCKLGSIQCGIHDGLQWYPAIFSPAQSDKNNLDKADILRI